MIYLVKFIINKNRSYTLTITGNADYSPASHYAVITELATNKEITQVEFFQAMPDLTIHKGDSDGKSHNTGAEEESNE